jgi:antitoxin MazE
MEDFMIPKPISTPADGRPLVQTLYAGHPRAGWEAEAREIAAAGDDALIWPEFANEDDAEFVW